MGTAQLDTVCAYVKASESCTPLPLLVCVFSVNAKSGKCGVLLERWVKIRTVGQPRVWACMFNGLQDVLRCGLW